MPGSRLTGTIHEAESTARQSVILSVWWMGAKDPLLTHERAPFGGRSFAPHPPPAQDDSEDEIVVGPPAGKNHRTYGNPRVRLRVPGAFRIDAAGSTISSIGSAFTTPVIPAIT